jgi:hypothetical protein
VQHLREDNIRNKAILFQFVTWLYDTGLVGFVLGTGEEEDFVGAFGAITRNLSRKGAKDTKDAKGRRKEWTNWRCFFHASPYHIRLLRKNIMDVGVFLCEYVYFEVYKDLGKQPKTAKTVKKAL